MRTVVLLILLGFNTASLAHTDLLLQIDKLGADLAADPGNTALLMKRGDLYRRHQDWQSARDDFDRVRHLDPDHNDIDWFAGRLEVDAGEPEKGIALLNRFLLKHPHHAVALQNRAQGYLQLGQPLPAARDYEVILQTARSPGPEIYHASAEAYMKAGHAHHAAALKVIQQGLVKSPAEISLTGLATDLSLAGGDSESALSFIETLPPPVLQLVQWKLRVALLDCQTGKPEAAAEGLRQVMKDPSRSRKAALLPKEAQLQALIADPDPKLCQAAATRF